MLIHEQLNNSLLDLLVSNLGRLDEKEDTDSQGVYKILEIFENLLSFMPPLADQIVTDTGLLPWVMKRIQVSAQHLVVARRTESNPQVKDFDSNKQYASQILAILVQSGRDNIMAMVELDGVEILLKVVSVRSSAASFHFS